MARFNRSIPVLLAFVCGMAATAAAQSAVEYGLNAGRAATTTAPAQGIGKAMSGIAGSLDKTVKASQQASDSSSAPTAESKHPGRKAATAARVRPAVSTPPAPAPNWEDPAAISAGLTYEDLMRRFGPPSLQITSATGNSLSYSGKDGMVQVEVQGGKVTSVEKAKS